MRLPTLQLPPGDLQLVKPFPYQLTLVSSIIKRDGRRLTSNRALFPHDHEVEAIDKIWSIPVENLCMLPIPNTKKKYELIAVEIENSIEERSISIPERLLYIVKIALCCLLVFPLIFYYKKIHVWTHLIATGKEKVLIETIISYTNLTTSLYGYNRENFSSNKEKRERCLIYSETPSSDIRITFEANNKKLKVKYIQMLANTLLGCCYMMQGANDQPKKITKQDLLTAIKALN